MTHKDNAPRHCADDGGARDVEAGPPDSPTLLPVQGPVNAPDLRPDKPGDGSRPAPQTTGTGTDGDLAESAHDGAPAADPTLTLSASGWPPVKAAECRTGHPDCAGDFRDEPCPEYLAGCGWAAVGLCPYLRERARRRHTSLWRSA